MQNITITYKDKELAMHNAWQLRCDNCSDWLLILYNGKWYSAHRLDLVLDDEELDANGEPLFSNRYLMEFSRSAGVSLTTAVKLLSRGRLFFSDEPDRPSPDITTWGQPYGYDLSGKEFENDVNQCAAGYVPVFDPNA